MSILHRWPDIQKLRKGEMVLPHFVDFHTSNLCNQHCVGCAYDGTKDGQMMSEDDHFRIVDDFIRLGVKAFDFAGGGEPTTLPYLIRLMRHIKDHGANFALITNGTLMRQELVDVLVEGAAYVRVSLEASNPDDYIKYKQVPLSHWTRALEAVKWLVDENRKAGGPVQISVRFSVGQSLRGRQHYQDIMKLAIDLDLDRFTVKALRHEPEELTEGERYKEQAECDRAAEEAGPTKICRSWIAPYPNERIPQCWLNPLHAVVDHLGNCYICCFYYYRFAQHCVGNVLNSRFEDIWFSEDHKTKVKAIRIDECRRVDCKFFQHHEAVDAMTKRNLGYWL